MIKSTWFRQVIIIGVVYSVASLDLMKPGYLTLANPIDLLPWNVPNAIQSLTRCNGKKSITLEFIPAIAKLVKTSTTVDNISRTLGEPVCVTGGNKIFVWDLKPYLFIDLQLRVRTDDGKFISTYDLLK
jgi:hypothetical protein